MKTIGFHKTSNIFINTGIVALHRYLDKFNTIENHSFGEIKNELLPNKLIIENNNILKLLEEVYYFMGKEIYNTPTKKQKDQSDKFYFVEEPFSFEKFPKMNSFGFAGFITKPPFGPQPTPRVKPIKYAKLFAENSAFAHKIAKVYKENNLKLKFFEFKNNTLVENKDQKKGDSNIYLDEPYSKVPRLSFDKKYFNTGDLLCPLVNMRFKTLMTSKGTFALTSNLENFNSHLMSDDNIKISIIAKLLGYFSAGLAMYTYYNGYDKFSVSFFNSNNLLNIDSLYEKSFFYTKEEMECFKLPFQKNIRLEKFRYPKKDTEYYELGGGEESYSPTEITFLLIYTFFKKKFQFDFENENLSQDINPFYNTPYEKIPISIVTLKADKFASTMRPNFFEEYSNIKFIVRLMFLLESNKPRVSIGEMWRGLIVKTQKSDSIKNPSKRKHLERNMRTVFFSQILKNKTLLSEVENLFNKSYLQLVNNKSTGYRKYNIFLEFLKIYEPLINFGGMKMDKNLQQRALNLGKSIGYGILNFDGAKSLNDKKANAKNGRKYIIGMQKARTITQFRDVLIRVQRKYAISISNEILENIDEGNFIAIKQYAQLGALNTLNPVLSNQKSNQDEN